MLSAAFLQQALLCVRSVSQVQVPSRARALMTLPGSFVNLESFQAGKVLFLS